MDGSIVYYLLLVYSSVTFSSVVEHKQIGEVKYGVHIEPYHEIIKREANQNIRIYIYNDSSLDTNLPSDVKSRLQNVIIPRLKNFFQSLLMVRPLMSPILLQRDCTGNTHYPFNINTTIRCSSTCEPVTRCGQVVVPENHLKACIQCNGSSSTCQTIGSSGSGINNIDFILYVSAVTTSTCGTGSNGSPSTIAFAKTCQMESGLDRPIAGSINFCPSAFTDSRSDEFIFTVAKHEVIHSLAFSTLLYPFFRKSDGTPRTPRDDNGFPPIVNSQYMWSNDTILEVRYSNWRVISGTVEHVVNMFVTPKVVEEGRKYFNCSTLQGVELENQFGSGSALSHWEKRILGNELMTAVIDAGPKLSNITLALLEDSGWYKVDYQLGESLEWGLNSGCTLPTSSCLEYILEQQSLQRSILPFCNESGVFDCIADRRYVGKCIINTYGINLPAEYRYYNNPAMGGVQIADYCPYAKEFTYEGGRGTECSNVTNQPPENQDFYAETYGQGSLCFNQPGPWRFGNTLSQNYGGGCYQFSCNTDNTILTLYVRGVPMVCTPGQTLDITSTSQSLRIQNMGQIICPTSVASICQNAVSIVPSISSSTSTVATVPTNTGTAPTNTGTAPPTSGATSLYSKDLFVLLLAALISLMLFA